MDHELTTYTDETVGYSLRYPAGWRVTTDPDGGATFEPAGPPRGEGATGTTAGTAGASGRSADSSAGDGATASAGASTADVGAVVFVDRKLAVRGSPSLQAYVAAFLDELRDDAHVHSLEVQSRRDVTLSGEWQGQVVECAYVGEGPAERWRLLYLFVVDGDTGYTVGVDWNDALPVGDLAATIVGSFDLADRSMT